MSENTARFTPGPWRVDVSTVIYIRPEGQGFILATLAPLSLTYASGSHNVIANADIMAAAPDLYAVVLQVAEHFADTDAPLGAAARAAIAKAEGRQP